jgi:hypothetical protein
VIAQFITYHFLIFNKKWKHQIIGLMIILFVSVNGFAQQNYENETKSAFILKISGFVEWPQASIINNPNFNIYILGDSPIEKILISKVKTSGLKIKNKIVNVKRISSAKEATNCQILFISSSEKNKLPLILKVINKSSILTISDTQGFSESGVMVNLFMNGQLSFVINKKTAEASGIYISSKILAYAKSVIK